MSLEEDNATAMPIENSPTKNGETEHHQSPSKKRKMGITEVQKQALVENLQLEIAERARKLRSNYNIHAQSLRTRIEIRVNRIPMSLRKMKMGDLLQKYSPSSSTSQGQLPSAIAPSTSSKPVARGPPVPEKDNAPERTATASPQKVYPMAPPPPSARPVKRRSNEMAGGDKENEIEHVVENPKKRSRANPPAAIATNPPTHVLSPTSSNTRTLPRNNPPPPAMTPGSIRSGIARTGPVSPTKGTASTSNLLHSVVRPTASRPPIPVFSPRKPTLASTAGSSSITASARKRGATVGAGPPLAISRSGTRTANTRRVSGTSESSEGSTSTVIKHKRPATAPGDRPPPPKASATSTTTARKAGAAVVNSLKKAGGVASGSTTAATKKAAAAASGGSKSGTAGRVLRKRA
ncbi:Borealin N terminal-domain-containing protein [Podospora fimiseda]|uniref:Borealin N terminal-domain-containing protein n=1 Tax=Podospora fimiseda TaxID=252190 RepID=A0AAN7H0Q4_9PEZI|nr:Borealin N terminal-domain-containing protein [Podospora fimiseda]